MPFLHHPNPNPNSYKFLGLHTLSFITFSILVIASSMAFLSTTRAGQTTAHGRDPVNKTIELKKQKTQKDRTLYVMMFTLNLY